MKTRRLTKKEMWIFAIGQLGWSILSGIVTTWLVTYYLPTESSVKEGALFYVPTGLIIFGALTILGLITFICRIFDAVTDPWIASLSDRSKNPKGRRIPFMKRAAVPFAIVTVLIFFAPLGVKEGEPTSPLNIVWVLVTLILFYLFMTMYCTPYNALISEFGKTQEDRMFISTAISLTFFFGTLLAYLPFALAGMLRSMVPYAWSYRIWFIVLAVFALICMLIPVFKLNEKDFVDAKPSESNAMKSLVKTFRNKEFRKFSCSDIAYWIGLTLFQTGLPFFVTVSMKLDESNTMLFMGGMTVLSACFYPFVSRLVAKFGKKKESYQWVKYAALNVCVFSSVNWMAFYCLFKENLCAERVDGQWVLGCIYSGVLAAAVVVLNGVILDFLRSYYCEDTEWERLEDSKKK